MSNQKGQSIVELCVALPICSAIFAALFSLSYIGLSQNLIHHFSEEALLCSTVKHKHFCENSYKENISRFLIFGKLTHIYLNASKYNQSQIETCWKYFDIDFCSKRDLVL